MKQKGLIVPKKEMPNLIEIEHRLKKMEVTFDETPSLVFDNGSDSIKSGLSGRPFPKLIKSSAVHPVNRGIIEDFEAMTSLWRQSISYYFPKRPAKLNVVVINSPIPAKRKQKEVAEIFFEKLGVDSIAFVNGATMSLFSTGKAKGLVVEIGGGVSSVAPIYEGYALQRETAYMDLAGQDITAVFEEKLASISEEAKKMAKKMKEEFAAVALHYEQTMNLQLEKEVEFTLPDGNKAKFKEKLKYYAPEVLFKPEIAKAKVKSLTKMVLETVKACPKDIRSEDITLAGGSTYIKGLRDRLKVDLYKEGLVVDAYSDPQRKYAAWIGASMLSSFSTFAEMRVSRAQYREDPDIIFKKAL